MVRLARWLLGCVSFKFSGGFAEGFLNDCLQTKINVHKLKIKGNDLYGICLAPTYKQLHKIALKNGGVVRIVKKQGFIFPLLKLKNRWGLLVGLVAFVAIINLLGGFVWNIDIVGNSKISDEEITAFLTDNNFYIGVYWDSVDKSSIESLAMASFDDLAWIQINQIGSTARVEINEAVAKPKIDNSEGAANLVATKDGIIVKATTYDGWQVASVGDGVTSGDLLVSGVYESEATKRNVFAHASGEFIAQVQEPFSLTVNRQQSSKAYKNEKICKSISFFGIKIPLYIGSSKINDSDITQSANYITLNNRQLPIGIITKSVKPYTVVSSALNDSELTKLTKAEIEKKISTDFADCEIQSENISITLNADNAIATGTVTVLENIGKEVVIKDTENITEGSGVPDAPNF